MTKHPKAILLVESLSEEVDNVYSSAVLSGLALAARQDSLPRYSEETLASSRNEFSAVEYIFSTWNMPSLSGSQIDDLFPSLKAVFYAAGTVKYFAVPFFERGIRVFSAASINADPVAEYATAQILLAGKGFYRSRVTSTRHFFAAKRGSACFSGNYRARVGILGAGNIGRRVISMLRREEGMAMEILAYDPYVSEAQCEELGCRKASLEEVFRECDVISNHMPDIPDTRGVLNAALFDFMKPAATFINTARGAQVVERDLAASLRKEKTRTALLDVTYPEVIRPWNPLLRCENAYITPHIAGSVGREKERLGEAMAIVFEDVLAGRPSSCEVDPGSLVISA